MLSKIENLPSNVLGIRATGKITSDDYHQVVFPAFEAYRIRFERINYMLVLDTRFNNFTIDALLNDAVLGFQYLTRWSRVAIVSDQEGVINFTNIFGVFVPGTYKGFPKSRLQEAIAWVAHAA